MNTNQLTILTKEFKQANKAYYNHCDKYGYELYASNKCNKAVKAENTKLMLALTDIQIKKERLEKVLSIKKQAETLKSFGFDGDLIMSETLKA